MVGWCSPPAAVLALLVGVVGVASTVAAPAAAGGLDLAASAASEVNMHLGSFLVSEGTTMPCSSVVVLSHFSTTLRERALFGISRS